MDATISLSQLGLVVLLMVGLAAAVYLVITLKNFNEFTFRLVAILEKNEVHFNRTMENLSELTSNTAHATEELKAMVQETGKAVKLVSQDVTDTVLAVNRAADHVTTYAVVINEIVRSLINLFSERKA